MRAERLLDHHHAVPHDHPGGRRAGVDAVWEVEVAGAAHRPAPEHHLLDAHPMAPYLCWDRVATVRIGLWAWLLVGWLPPGVGPPV
ncbi:MAG TPA: hypothetical protein VGR74_08910, partial [Actinomycetota bacterium]|nr:hypothetical protein [Actinomycetota bacterium]